MDINKKPSKSNSTPFVIALIFIPILFIFGTMLIVGIVLTTNRPDIKLIVSEATNIQSDQATFTLSVEGDSNRINEKGFVYGTASNPEIRTRSRSSNPVYEIFNGYSSDSYRNIGNYIELDKNSNVGTIDDLVSETKYYVRAYAMTDYGTIYSNEISFKTLGFNESNSLNNSFNNILPKDSTPASRDAKRRADVNLILEKILQLREQDSESIIFKKNDVFPRNIRVYGSGRCINSITSTEEKDIYMALKNLNYTIPSDPMSKTNGCSDYSIIINLNGNNNIRISAPNSEIDKSIVADSGPL